MTTTSLSHPPTAITRDGWTLHHLDATASTNAIAATLPAWHAVRAQTQTAGRGRTGRSWVSDEGGLWLSAVLPCPGERSRWSVLPLAAGWSIASALSDIGARGLRLRWPNDVMVGRNKLAGLLVERFRDDTAVVGIGLNVFNHPEAADPALEGETIRLADLVTSPGELDSIERVVLRALREAHQTLLTRGFRPIADQLNVSWSSPRHVEVTLNGAAKPFQGFFQGIDGDGRLRVAVLHEGERTYAASDVALLREIE